MKSSRQHSRLSTKWTPPKIWSMKSKLALASVICFLVFLEVLILLAALGIALWF